MVLVASLGACAAATEPPKVATVSTETPPAGAAATASAVGTATPIVEGQNTDSAKSARDSKSPPPEKPQEVATLTSEISTLDLVMLQALSSSAASSAVAGGTGGLVLGAGGGSIGSGGGASGSLGGLSSIGGSGPAGGTPTVKGPVVGVTIGNVAVSGGAVSNAMPVAAGMAAGFRRCLNKALQADPTSVANGGKLVVKAVVDKAGAVTSATTTAAGIPTTAVKCITQRVQSAQFAPPDTGASQIEIPVNVQVQ